MGQSNSISNGYICANNWYTVITCISVDGRLATTAGTNKTNKKKHFLLIIFNSQFFFLVWPYDYNSRVFLKRDSPTLFVRECGNVIISRASNMRPWICDYNSSPIRYEHVDYFEKFTTS